MPADSRIKCERAGPSTRKSRSITFSIWNLNHPTPEVLTRDKIEPEEPDGTVEASSRHGAYRRRRRDATRHDLPFARRKRFQRDRMRKRRGRRACPGA